MFGRLKIFRTFEMSNISICIKTDTTFYGYIFKPSRFVGSCIQVLKFDDSHKFSEGVFLLQTFLNYKMSNLFKNRCSVNNSSDTATLPIII